MVNFAPGKLDKSLKRRRDPLFLLRELCEDNSINTYTQARQAVLNWRVASPIFVTICGVARGESCVVEFGPDGEHSIVEADENGLTVVTNHYALGGKYDIPHNLRKKQFCDEDDCECDVDDFCSSLLLNSYRREEKLRAAFSALSSPLQGIELMHTNPKKFLFG